MLVTLDMPKSSLDTFKEMCLANAIEIQHIQMDGPGGGNPCVACVADTRQSAQALIDFYFN